MNYDGGTTVMERIVPYIIILCLLVGIMAWSLVMQRKSVARQKQAMDTQREAVERQKQAMAQVEESLRLTRQQVQNQDRIIALLEEIRDQLKKAS
jgi:type II secretory pathway pseudopilin PulG